MTAIAYQMFAAATGGMRPDSATITCAMLEPVVTAIAAGTVALNTTFREQVENADWQESYKPGPHQFTFDETTPSPVSFPRWLRFTVDAEKIALDKYEAPLVGTPVCAVTVHGAPKVASMAFILAVKDNGHVTATMRDVDMKLLPPYIFSRGRMTRVPNIFGDWAKLNFGAVNVLRAQNQIARTYDLLSFSQPGGSWAKVFGRLTA